jgi:hypothetical protein
MISIIVGLIVLAVVLWFAFNYREGLRMKRGQPRHSGLRLVFAAVGACLAIFSGGCSLFLLGDLLMRGPQQYMGWEVVAIVGGIPFAIATFIWWLSMRRAR